MAHEGTTTPSRTASPNPALIPTSDSGRNLEAAAPPPAAMEPADSIRRPQLLDHVHDLAEPEGTLTPLPVPPTPSQPIHSANFLPGTPTEETADIDSKFDHLLATLHSNRPADDLSIVRDAWAFCMQQHKGQKRASGEPYIIHPLEVGQVLAEMKMDSTAIAAGLLHDAVEDTPVTSPEIARRFGEQVAHIVEGVTKLDKIKFANKEDHQAENIRKMLLAMVTDIRVVLIKMADRLHNMRTLAHLRPDKQTRIARETLEIYAPLAHRLGMGKLRGEFEDLSFRYVDPQAYTHLSSEVEKLRSRGGEEFLATVVTRLENELKRHGLPGTVEYRTKRLYSIQQKLPAAAAGAEIDVAQVHDLYAVRIITQTMQDCYALLGLVQNLWRPVPGRIKDFIAMPRPNGYKSLHTTLVAEGGHQFEVQIRTEEMHRVAEDGIAAHWKYKANESVSAKDEQRLAWVRQLMEWQREMSDPNEFMSTLKIDLYPEEVYTFTPKGKVVVLPKDASPIDFAYTVHTEVGHTTVAAKVNGRIVPLRHRLRNGDIVEITTQAGHTPSRDWLTFAKSSRARNKIKHWLNEHQRERAIEIGTRLLEREARKFKVSLHKLTDADYTRVANDFGLGGQQDLTAAIGFGKYSARQTLNRLVPGSTAAIDPGAPRLDSGVQTSHDAPSATSAKPDSNPIKHVFLNSATDALQVEGQNDLLIYRARCCNPIRGEEIVGYVTRGKGVAVHARTCSNVQNLLYESDRRIQVEWSPTPEDLAEQLRKQQTVTKAARFSGATAIGNVGTPTQTAKEPGASAKESGAAAKEPGTAAKESGTSGLDSGTRFPSANAPVANPVAPIVSSSISAASSAGHNRRSTDTDATGTATTGTATTGTAATGTAPLTGSARPGTPNPAYETASPAPQRLSMHPQGSLFPSGTQLQAPAEAITNQAASASPASTVPGSNRNLRSTDAANQIAIAITPAPQPARNGAGAIQSKDEAASPSTFQSGPPAIPSSYDGAGAIESKDEAASPSTFQPGVPAIPSSFDGTGAIPSKDEAASPSTFQPGVPAIPSSYDGTGAIQSKDEAASHSTFQPGSPAIPSSYDGAVVQRPGRSEVRQAANYPKPTRFPVRLVITCDDRSGMLKQLTATISDDDTNIRSVETKSNPDHITANVEFVIETLDLRHLTKLTANLRRLPGVQEVHRVSKL